MPPKKSLTEIDSFSICLFEPKLILDDDRREIAGLVSLKLGLPIRNIRSLELRFVGGVTAKYDDKNGNALRGSATLFDQKITLLENHSTDSFMPAKQYSYDFVLRVPEGLPCTVSDSNIGLKIQYLLIAVLSFHNGCCGFLPFFAREPASAIKEVIGAKAGVFGVCPIIHRIESISNRLESPEILHKNPEEEIEGFHSTIWSPNECILVTIPSVVNLCRSGFHLRIACSLKTTITSIRWSIIQISAIEYHSNINFQKKIDDNIKYRKKETEYCKCVAEIKMEEVLGEKETKMSLNCSFSGGQKDLIPDINTNIAEVVHFISLIIHANQNTDGIFHAEQFQIRIPVYLINTDIEDNEAYHHSTINSLANNNDKVADGIALAAEPSGEQYGVRQRHPNKIN